MIDHTNTIIEVNNVTFSYNIFNVLKDVNLNIHKGDYLGIIGPNGGGKTTLIKIIMGLLNPQKGRVLLYNQEISSFNNRSIFGYVPQRLSIGEPKIPMSVLEAVTIGRFNRIGLFNPLTKKDKAIIYNALSEVGMEEKANDNIHYLSGGEFQRVLIAKALAGEPEILILDEPTAGIDVNAQEQFYSLLTRLNQKLNLTLLMVTHDIDVVAHQATELACINQTLVYHGAPKQFISSPLFEKLYGKEMKMVIHGH